MSKQLLLVFGTLVLCTACAASQESLSAGQIGCPESEISIDDGSTSIGWSETSSTWIAECRGRRFVCTKTTAGNGQGSDMDVSCHEELSSNSAEPAAQQTVTRREESGPLETGKVGPSAFTSVGGFEFGESESVARQACESAGHTWQGTTAKSATCTGTAADVGFAADATLTLCQTKVCGVILHHRPASNWASTLVDIKRSLVSKYGEPADSDATIPGECRAESDLVRCLETGRITPEYEWKWDSGETLKMMVGKPPTGDGDIPIRLYYAQPAKKARHINASGL